MIKCSVIKDLFPNYVSGLASADTRAIVDEHIETCQECHNKLKGLQNKVIVTLREKDDKNINVLKTIKKRIFRKNVIVAAIASVVSIAVILAGLSFVFTYETLMPYEKEMISVKSYTDSLIEKDRLKPTTFFDIICTKNYKNIYVSQRVFDLNEGKVGVMYFYLSETLYTRWTSRESVIPFGGLKGEMPPFDRMEIYYLIRPVDEVHSLPDKDFYDLRNDGVLLWSGTL